MVVKSQTIQLNTQGNVDVLDITDRVAQCLGESGLGAGILTIFCPSSTSGVTSMEYEPGNVKDLHLMFEEIAPSDRDYAHNARWGDGNGHSHARAALLKASLTVPFTDGRLLLGTWQQLVYVDFDNRPRRRELVVQIMGE